MVPLIQFRDTKHGMPMDLLVAVLSNLLAGFLLQALHLTGDYL